ncbi:MAG TPA: glycosyltransferase [Azospirillaceae bacterium]|nr:glycosyltransferase [Azospirillaceae bacterium]
MHGQIESSNIDLLIRSRRYADALGELGRAENEMPDGNAIRLRRQCLARLGRFEEAADVGRELLARGLAEPEDLFRQAQLFVECGAWSDAVDVALRGWDVQEDYRLAGPLAQAALACPSLIRRLPSGNPAPSRAPSDRIFVPQRMPYYAAADADHPGTMGMVRNARGLCFHVPAHPQEGWLGGLATTVEATLPILEQVLAMHPLIDMAAAARYLGGRLVSALPDADGAALDFLTNIPITIGHRPFVLWYDVLPTLFQPFQPFDRTAISAATSSCYWIVRGYLEAPHCLAVITHYALEGNPLLRLFRSAVIRDKLVYVRPCEAEEAPTTPVPRRPRDDERQPVRILFTSSRSFTGEGFFYRGGVDVLNAFLEVVDECGGIELILRTPLPATLSERLRDAVLRHPRINWIDGYLPPDEYERLFASADVFILPTSVLYRNGVVMAMKHGLVPLVSDVIGMEELVRHGETGVMVHGRRHLLRVDDDPPGVKQNLEPVLKATDRPSDPAFFAAFKDALRALVADRATLERLSHAAHAAAESWSGQRDLEAFEACMGRSLAQADTMRRRGERLRLPRQRL